MSGSTISKLIIRNFGCVGPEGVSVDIDKIVVLIGANNSGKSTILRAFEVITDSTKLTLDDFHNRVVSKVELPEIELLSVVDHSNKPGDEWCEENGQGFWEIREKWTWSGVNVEPERRGFNFSRGRWAEQGDAELVPWGMDNLARSKRPKAHRVDASADAEAQARAATSLLKALLDEQLRGLKSQPEDPVSRYDEIIEQLRVLRSDSKKLQKDRIDAIQESANELLSKIFPSTKFGIVSSTSEASISIDLLGDEFSLEISDGAAGGIPLARQGSGTRRTVLWTLLKLLADLGYRARAVKSNAKTFHEPVGANKSHVLLLDEPEISLHPKAIEQVRDVLYSLPDSLNWQVMVATHSPSFVDLTRDHTTIVRVERSATNEMKATTLYRPEDARLSDDEKENLKLVNLFDSHISAAFFGGRVLIVEGDTEYSAFSRVLEKEKSSGLYELADISIIRARGKATVASMMKVLNHFKTSYFVLHDTDSPRTFSKRLDKDLSVGGLLVYKRFEINNPAWKGNEKIAHQMRECSQVFASVMNIELALFGEATESDKPENIVSRMRNDEGDYEKVKKLLLSILGVSGHSLPKGFIKWSEISQLQEAYEEVATSSIVSTEPPANLATEKPVHASCK